MSDTVVERIFLSYGRKDGAEFASRLAADLKLRGPWRIWIDQEGIREGRSWDTEIERAIRSSDVFASVLTPHSVAEGSVCRDEVVCAYDAGKALITLRIVDDPSLKPVLLLLRRQWIDFSRGYEQGLDALVLYLEGNDSRVQRPLLEIVSDIRPLDFGPEIARLATGFVGRAWLLEELDRWLERPSKRALAIVGPPGSGKSSIAAWLATSHRDVAAAHFCSSSNTHSLSAWYFVATAVSMLHGRLDGFRQAVDLRYPSLRHDTASDAFRELVVEPLIGMKPPDWPQFVIVDALDESVIVREGKTVGESIVDVLAEQARDLPNWLRLLVTTQPVPDVMRKLGDFDLIQLGERVDQNRQDALQYLRKRLGHAPSERGVADRLAALADGNFLMLKHAVDALEESHIAPEELGLFARGLATSYTMAFSRRYSAGEYRDRLAPLLCVLSTAYAPIPVQLLVAATGRADSDIQMSLQRLEPYLRLAGSGAARTYTLFHPYLRRWLTDPTLAGDYYVSPDAGHTALANATWAEFLNGADEMSEYAKAHLSVHLLESKQWDELLRLVQDTRFGLLSRWIDQGEGEMGVACMTGIIRHLAKDPSCFETEMGLTTQLARLHIRRGAYQEAERSLDAVLQRTSWLRARRARAVAMHERGSLHLYSDEYEEAAAHYRRAMWLCRLGTPRYHDETAANLVGLAVVEQENHRLRNAVRYGSLAIRAAARGHDAAHHVAALRVQALAWRGIGRYEDAEAALRTATVLSVLGGAVAETPRLLLIQGWVEFDRDTLAGEALERSKATFERALEESVRLANRYCIMEAKLSLAWRSLAAGAAPEGERWLDELQALLSPGRHLGLWAGHSVARARVLHVRKHLPKSCEAYQDAIGLCREMKNITWGIRARVGMGAALWSMGERERAEESWNEAVNMLPSEATSLKALAARAIAQYRQ